MSEAILQASIKAFDEFSATFEKFVAESKKAEQSNEQLAKSSNMVSQAMTSLFNAKNKAKEAAEKYNKILAESASGAKKGASSAQELYKAYTELSNAEKLVELHTKQLTTALATQGVTGAQAQNAIRQIDQSLAKMGRTSATAEKEIRQIKDTTADFLQTIGQVGALYAFQRGMLDVMATGREFQLVIRQTQAVTDDYTRTLRDMAMASKGGNLDVYGPREQAKAFLELGQAGASTNEILAATPDILEFGTAAILDLDKAAYGVLATAKSFSIALTDSRQITDAYTEAMNRGSLAGQDFQWIMSSVGAVGKMAGQDFREILAVGSTMKDAGVQAQDAGTSIKSALVALMNPTKEAQELMKTLGINIYDASGRMKQWSEITAEFEKALGPYNEKSRQFALTTIFGSDGIRAMATSLNKGSGYLKEFALDLATADGATHKMATAISDTFDGAIRKANASLEKAKVLLFEDFANGAVVVLGALDKLIEGFNNMSEAERYLVEGLVGASGLIVALTVLINLLKTVGITAQFALGPWGKAIGVFVTLATTLMGIKSLGGVGEQLQVTEEAQKKTKSYVQSLEELVDTSRKAAEEVKGLKDQLIAQGKIEELITAQKVKLEEKIVSFGALTKEEAQNISLLIQRRQELKSQVEQGNRKAVEESKAITDLLQAHETLTKEFLKTSKLKDQQIEVSNSLKKALGEEAVKRLEAAGYTKEAINIEVRAIQDKLEKERQYLQEKKLLQAEETRSVIENARKRMSALKTEYETQLGITKAAWDKANNDTSALPAAFFQSSPSSEVLNEVLGGNGPMLLGVQANRDLMLAVAPPKEVDAEIQKTKKVYDKYKEQVEFVVSKEEELNKLLNEITTGNGDGKGAGDKDLPVGGGGGNKAADAARRYTEAITAALYGYKTATESASNAVALLGSKEQYLSQVMQSGQGTMYQAVELNKVRAQQLTALNDQQDALHQQNVAIAQALDALKEKYAKTTDPEAARELRNEIDNLTQSMVQNSQAWWQAEQQKLALGEKVRQEEQKRYNDAYQKATDLMRHQVNMARMSTEQQIAFYQKLRDAHQWTQQQMFEIDENLYRLRRQQLNEYLQKLDEAYQEELASIEENTRAITEDLQEQINALEQEGKTSGREEVTRKHNEKIKKLQEQRRYHELRTGQEHAQAILDLDKELAEEQLAYQQQLEEWTREDKKEALQQKIEDAQEAGNEERRNLEEHYRRAKEIAEDGMLDIIASLAATSPQWFETGKTLIDEMIRGMLTGDFSVVDRMLGQVGDVASMISMDPDIPGSSASNPLFTLSPGQYSMIGDTAVLQTRSLAQFLGLPVDYNPTTGQVKIGNKWFNPLLNDNGTTYVSIRDVAEAMGYEVDWDNKKRAISIYKAFASGGPVHETGPAILHAGEYVVTASLVDAIKRGAPPPSSLSSSEGSGGTTIILNGPLLAAENVMLADDDDVEGVSRDIWKNINTLALSMGR